MKQTVCLIGLALLFWIQPVAAAIFVQCPKSFDGGSTIVWNDYAGLTDLNGDGILRASDGEIPNAYQTALDPTRDQVCLHLAAGDGFLTMADGTEQYIFGFADANGHYNESVMNTFALGAHFPAPTIKVRQGDHVYLSLTNVGMVMRPDLPDPHTVHWHGFPNASAIFDGVPDSSISIGMGATLTYYYQVVEAGTFLYHCHVEATEHMQMGMLGNLYVEAAQAPNSLSDTLLDGSSRSFPAYAYNGRGDFGYDVDFPLQIHSFDPEFHDANLNVQPLPFAAMEDRFPMFNGRGYPDSVNPAGDLALVHPHGDKSTTPALIEATAGQRILLRISSLSTTSFHSLTVLGLPMEVIGVGSRGLVEPYYTQTVNIGGGEAIDVLIDTSQASPGIYQLYTTNLDHLANHDEDFGGMLTEIRLFP